MSYRLPQNRIWNQNNLSDLYGDIWSSWNLNLTDELGKLKTTRTLAVARSVDDGSDNYVSGLGLAAAFRYYNGRYYAAVGSDAGSTIAYVATTKTGAFSLDSATDKPTSVSDRYSDMEVFNERLYVSLKGITIARNDAGTWLNGDVPLTNGVSSRPHMMCSYADRLYCTVDYAKINSCGINEVFPSMGESNTLDLANPTNNTITCLRATSSRIWILTLNRSGGKGHIYAWDGSQTSINESYKLGSSGAMAGIVKDDVLYVIDNDGRLLAFNGGTFVEIDRLPFKKGQYGFFALGEYNNRWIHPNGMTLKDNGILILVDNEYRGASATWEENVPSGIWEWTKETGLYHKYSFSYTNDNDDTILDYGQNHISIAGALSYIKSASTSATDNGSLLAGVQLFTDASTTDNMIFIDDLADEVQKYGYFITPKIFSQNITDIWQKLVVRFKKFLDSDDQMVIKYRTEDAPPLDIAITAWANSQAVNTSTDISDYAVGDEIEFLQGQGSGKCFHIASITDLGGGSTQIGLDAQFDAVGGTGKARIQKWKKLSTITSQSVDFAEFPLLDVKNSTWVQFKVCIQNTGDSYIYDLTLINAPNQKAI